MPASPQQFHDFILLREISRGGMGVVYHGQHQQTGQDCAIKLLLDATDPRSMTRFEREARALSMVSHPHVLSLLDYGVHQGTPYLVTELIRGQTLREHVEASISRLSTQSYQNWIAGIIKAVAHALDACHKNGLIHRDIKPDNILIEEKTGRPVLIDFGLVKKDPEGGRFDSVSLTKTGDVLGTIHYMAPEQLDSVEFGEVGAHSDIWALGATLLYGLTGEQPFKGDSVMTLYTAIVMGEPPKLQSINKSTPRWLQQLCADCLTKNSKERIQLTALIELLDRPEPITDFAQALDLSMLASHEQSPKPSEKKGLAALFSVFILTALGLFLALYEGTEPLTVDIQNPQPGEKLYPGAVLVKGRASQGLATITVLGQSIPSSPDGSFQSVITIPEGKQDLVFIVRAEEGSGVTTVKDIRGELSPETLRSTVSLGREAVPALMVALKDRNQFIQSAAAETLGQIGAPAEAAVPSLILAVRQGSAVLRSKAALALGRIGPAAISPLRRLLKEKDIELRRAGLNALIEMGPKAEEAIPALIEALRDRRRDLKFAASKALSQIGEPALKQVILASQDKDSDVRVVAITAIGKLGKGSRAAVEALVVALDDKNLTVRRCATDALGQVGPIAHLAILPLSRLLRSSDRGLRDLSITAVGRIGPKAAPAVPALINCLTDPNRFVRESAAQALGNIGPHAKAAIPGLIQLSRDRIKKNRTICGDSLAKIGPAAISPLIKALNQDHPWNHESLVTALSRLGEESAKALIRDLNGPEKVGHPLAIKALGAMGAKAKAAIPTLIETSKSETQSIRLESIVALGQMGHSASKAVPILIIRLRDSNSAIQSAAAQALGQMGPGAQAAVSPLIEQLQNRDLSVQKSAAEALGRLGELSESAIPKLVNWLDHDKEELRKIAGSALAKIGEKSLPPLLDALKNGPVERRRSAVLALGQMGERAVPGLAKIVQGSDDAAALAAIWSLTQIGPAAKGATTVLIRTLKREFLRQAAGKALEGIGQPAIPFLLSALKSTDSDSWEAAAQTLGAMGAKAKDAVPHLISELKGTKSERRRLAARVLGQIGPEANSAVPALTSALQSPDKELQQQILKALGKIEGSN